MKKLNLFVALFAIGMGSAIAQPTINAVTPGQLNISTVGQTGEKNTANVDQSGLFNTSKISQETKDNFADVTQINFRGFDIPTWSEINQKGVGNSATVEQTSTGQSGMELGQMTAIINQVGDTHIAVQKQGASKQQGISYEYIDQSGFGNTATQNQKKYGNSAVILQSGAFNVALQGQDADLIDEDYIGSHNTAKINQTGYGNDAAQHQVGEANQATITQPGVLNLAIQRQDFLSNNNIAEITQSGATNEAYQTQIGVYSKATIEQPGDNNNFVQNQSPYSIFNNAYGIQSGDDNKGRQNQSGFYDHATIYQFSDHNEALQEQVSLAYAAGNMNEVDGVVMLNKATILQEIGECNIAKQFQMNLGGRTVFNEAIAIQSGEKNYSLQCQNGGASYSLVQQAGGGNSAEVSQSILVIKD
jgi:hypothetical protein